MPHLSFGHGECEICAGRKRIHIQDLWFFFVLVTGLWEYELENFWGVEKVHFRNRLPPFVPHALFAYMCPTQYLQSLKSKFII